MKTFANKNAQSIEQAVSLMQQARKDGQAASVAGGGSDLLGMVKELSGEAGHARQPENG